MGRRCHVLNKMDAPAKKMKCSVTALKIPAVVLINGPPPKNVDCLMSSPHSIKCCVQTIIWALVIFLNPHPKEELKTHVPGSQNKSATWTKPPPGLEPFPVIPTKTMLVHRVVPVITPIRPCIFMIRTIANLPSIEAKKRVVVKRDSVQGDISMDCFFMGLYPLSRKAAQ